MKRLKGKREKRMSRKMTFRQFVMTAPDRQLRILAMTTVLGMLPEDVAKAMSLAPRTVTNHLQSIADDLGLPNRLSLVKTVWDSGAGAYWNTLGLRRSTEPTFSSEQLRSVLSVLKEE